MPIPLHLIAPALLRQSSEALARSHSMATLSAFALPPQNEANGLEVAILRLLMKRGETPIAPIMAIGAFALVETVEDLLPFSFGFAAGAMIALVLVELLPNGLAIGFRQAVLGSVIGAAAMFALSAFLGV